MKNEGSISIFDNTLNFINCSETSVVTQFVSFVLQVTAEVISLFHFYILLMSFVVIQIFIKQFSVACLFYEFDGEKSPSGFITTAILRPQLSQQISEHCRYELAFFGIYFWLWLHS